MSTEHDPLAAATVEAVQGGHVTVAGLGVSGSSAALSRQDPGSTVHHSVLEFAERYSERGRCPAHDQLDALRG